MEGANIKIDVSEEGSLTPIRDPPGESKKV